MIKTLIIADDLSGAADCAIACKVAGAETVVVIDAGVAPKAAAVVSVDVNSRTMSLEDAGPAAATVVERLYDKDVRILYQKVDSTLRGNWVAELIHIRQAARKVLTHAPFVIVAPAFPDAGRTTIDGHVFVNGARLEDTEIWKREALTGPADLRALLQRAGLKVELAKLEQIALGAEALNARFVRCMEDGFEAVVCDAQTEDDLLSVAEASLALPERPLWVGSAGLMRVLAKARKADAASFSPLTLGTPGKPILVVVGSASGVSCVQFEVLAQEPGVTALFIPPSSLRRNGDLDRTHVHIQAIDEALRSGSDVAVMIRSEEVHLQEGSELAAALAELIAPRLSRVGGLIVTGGETARAILVKSEISGLMMQGEVEPGVPIGLSIGKTVIPVITKAGAFGDPTTLLRCRAALRGSMSDHSYSTSGQ